ncbi:MAG: hypothetical protein CSB47_11495 [Proteobacteria bacterium]|nr:MAG: hypothetical protein CSB47_11495 [Pseudomonadota bacterium]
MAKKVIQVCVVKHKQVRSNTEMTPDDFSLWLSTQRPATIVFEACATSNDWKQSAKLVANIRQNQKTDKNDALAIVQASQLIDIQFIKGKSFSQQELQSISKMRELAVKQKVALTHQINALLLEFTIRVSPRNGGLAGEISV